MSDWIQKSFENGWSRSAYDWLRAAMGAYLVVHFAALLPYATELFSSAGVVPDAGASPLLALFPNVLGVLDAPEMTVAFLATGVLAAGALAMGLGDRVAAVFCWYLLACLFGRNPLIANPSLPYVGWLLLAHAAFGPGRSHRGDQARWRMPAAVFAVAWLVMAAGYSYSGITKLASPSWIDGSAIAHVLENPLARATGLRVLLLELTNPVLQWLSWATLVLELAFLPLALVSRLRPFLWAAMVSLHLGLLLVVDFADLTLGMLLLHAFTFDPDWIRRARTAIGPTIREVGRLRSQGWTPFVS